jgi:hypothetical protein
VNLPLSRDRWPAEWRELFEERAAIMEFQGNLGRFAAETRAEQDIRKLAATREYRREEQSA